jgi:hypothetical protein
MRLEAFGKAIATVGPTLGLFLTGTGLIMTAVQNGHAARVNSADIALRLDDRLLKPPFSAILDRVYNDQPGYALLADSHGPISDDDMDALLGTYDTLYHLRRENLIDKRLTYNVFCTDLETVHANREVQVYLAQTRHEPRFKDADLGFDRLNADCLEWDKSNKDLER